MKKFTLILTILITATIVIAQTRTAFEKAVFHNDRGDSLLYRIMKPITIDENTKYPLVLFLHGAGERGDDNEKHLNHVVSDFSIPQNRAKYPCYVVAPQCPRGKQWVDADWGLDKHSQSRVPTLSLRLSKKLIEKLIDNEKVDPKRIYVIGISMGGFGAWEMITRYPDFFAAAVPVCGGGDELKVNEKVATTSVWAFHSTNDEVVKVSRTKNMIKAFKDKGGNPKYTEYQNLGHNCWTKAFEEEKIFDWLFEQKNK